MKEQRREPLRLKTALLHLYTELKHIFRARIRWRQGESIFSFVRCEKTFPESSLQVAILTSLARTESHVFTKSATNHGE